MYKLPIPIFLEGTEITILGTKGDPRSIPFYVCLCKVDYK